MKRSAASLAWLRGRTESVEMMRRRLKHDLYYITTGRSASTTSTWSARRYPRASSSTRDDWKTRAKGASIGNGNARHAGVSTNASSMIAGALHSDIGTKSFMARNPPPVVGAPRQAPARRNCTVANSSRGTDWVSAGVGAPQRKLARGFTALIGLIGDGGVRMDIACNIKVNPCPGEPAGLDCVLMVQIGPHAPCPAWGSSPTTPNLN